MSAAPGTVAAVSEDDVVAITTDVWQCFLGAGEEEPFLPLPAGDLAGDHYVATVSVGGAWSGQVVLELPVPAAVRAARRMLAVEEVTEAETADAVGELVNMVGGNIKGLVPSPSELGLPVVLHGSVSAPAVGRGAATTCSVSFTWAGDPVRITVWESEASPHHAHPRNQQP